MLTQIEGYFRAGQPTRYLPRSSTPSGLLAPVPSVRFYPLDAAAVAGDFDLRHLRWDQPGIERIARTVLAAGDARPPTIQRDNLDVDLLAGREVDICVLVDIPAEALRRDVIMARRNIAIECAAVCDSPDIAAVHVDQTKIEALGGYPRTVEPHPGLARRDWRCRCRGRRWWLGAPCHD